MSNIFDHEIQGIPCQIEIDTFNAVPPWRGGPMTAPSDADARGYYEIEYTVLDRKGYEAPWLDVLKTKDDDKRIEELIINMMEDEHE